MNDTNNAVAIRSNTGMQLNDGPSVLGEREIRIPIGGKVRSGIKVLIRKYENGHTKDLYERGVAAGASFAQIDKRLIKLLDPDGKKNIRTTLTPKNVPYFTVRRADFAMPEVAQQIMELYGEEREEGFHLYRLPIILPTDSWLSNMPHGMKSYTASELKYWSKYGPDGNRYCMTRGEAKVNGQNQRARKVFGGRPEIVKGPCDPNNCPVYQDNKCKLSGQLLFYIPGIPGSGAIELSTNSFYSLDEMRRQMQMVLFVRGGRISGTVDGRPVFYLTKVYEEVSMLDETGKPKRVRQWLIRLQADIDMGRLFQQTEPREALTSGAQAAAALVSAAAPADNSNTPVADDTPYDQVMTAIAAIGIAADDFAIYAEAQHGEDWQADDTVLQLLLTEVTDAGKDPQLFALKVANADKPF